jgi:hypothetical protein
VDTNGCQRAGGASISAFSWITVGVTVWLVIAALVGLLIGRMIRGRDRQIPQDSPSIATPQIPTQSTSDPATNPIGPRERYPHPSHPHDSEQRPPG